MIPIYCGTPNALYRNKKVKWALELSEGTPAYAAVVSTAARKLARDPEEARRLCAAAGQGIAASRLRAACLKACVLMPAVDKVPILA